MADRPDYDVYLNGLGYMLARDGRGGVMGGACQELGRDPLQYYLNAEQRWNEVVFRFGAGAGAIEYDGTHRYRWGENIDTRGGILRRGPAFHGTAHSALVRYRPRQGMAISDEQIDNTAGGVDGFAVQVTGTSNMSLSAAVLVKRDPDDYHYTGAMNFTVELWSDAADTPNAQLATVNCSFEMEGDDSWYWYSCDPWAAGEYFWFFVDLGYTWALGTKYWLVIRNANAYPVFWGRTAEFTAMTSEWNGAAWSAGSADQDGPLFQIGPSGTRLGMVPVALEMFRGSDGVPRLYAAVGQEVLYWRKNLWIVSRSAGGNVTDLCAFNARLLAARGTANDLENSTGATASTVWAAVANERAICFGVHDGMLWKAGGTAGSPGGEFVSGSLTGIGGYGNLVTVGDPGTIVTALCSHGGALFAAKEEGIYQIDYPDGYPGTGTPTANLVLDFKTDRCLRPWLVSWQGGLYFPGTAAVYEWKNDVLRDIWTDRVDEGAQEVSQGSVSGGYAGGGEVWTRTVPQYTAVRRFAASEAVKEDQMGFFQRGIGTTRGLVVSLTSPHLAKAGIWWYDGRGWHPMGPSIAEAGDDPLLEGIYADYILALFMDSYGAGKGRLWFGCGFDVLYWVMPTWTRDRTQLEGVDFNPAWSVDLPVYDGGKPDIGKYFHSVQIMTKNAGTDPRVKVWFMIDGDRAGTGWTALADYVTEDVFQEIGIGLVGRNIRFKLTGYYADDDSTALEVEAVRLLYQVLPETMETYQVVLRAANVLKARSGVTCDRTGATIKGELMGLLEETAPWGYTDPLGDLRTVWALDVSSVLVSTQDPAGQGGPPVEMQVTVKMIKSTHLLNLVVNGAFLLGIEDWSLRAGTPTWENGLGYPDVGCAKVEVVGIALEALDQTIEIPQAGTYELSMWVRTPDADDGLEVEIQNDDDTHITYLDVTVQCSEVDTWEYKSWEVALPKTAVRVFFGVQGLPNETFYVDSVRLTYPAE